MTLNERNNMNDRDRIKQYIENTMRKLCDDICDSEIMNMDIVEISTKTLVNFSNIYKNMGFDKECEKNDA